MPQLNPSAVQIPSIVNDMIVIEIKDNTFSDKYLTYDITDARKRICRRGQFRGQYIQLRVTHLQDGKYAINLHSTDADNCSFLFEKISGFPPRHYGIPL